MKLKFIFPGKTKEKFYAQGLKHYLERLAHMIELKEHIIKSATPKGRGTASETQARALESSYILEHCQPNDYNIICDLSGKQISSESLARQFQTLQMTGIKNVNLIVGGPWGLEAALVKKADLKLSFSLMTFPHELARLILAEQVYRAFAIINRIPYHK